MAEGVALTWEGNYRKPKPKSKDALSYESERTSANSSLRGIGVMNTNGKLTEEGIRLLQLGKVYGASSAAFLRYFGRLILENGQHLELIFWIENQPLCFIKSWAKSFIKMGLLRVFLKVEVRKRF
jgi:hypothetical protein